MTESQTTFSVLHRKQSKTRLRSELFDLLVVGGGVTGCGIALDAAARGLKVALVEQKDFASGTSSKSTKLIHGGLRYLKQLDIALVRETGTERAIVHRLAPHLVLPEKMLMPLVKGGTYGKFATSIGLKIYDILAGVKGDDRRKMLNKKQTLALEPLLDANGLIGGGYYAEYRTDDARLTIELIKTATRFGALAINYCKVEDFIYENGIVTGAKCRDSINDDKIIIKSKKVVSATGPWVDELRKRDGSLSGKRLHLTKGVHIVFPFEKLPLKHTTYFDGPDGRMIFAIPRGRVTYIGTTDTNYNSQLGRIVSTKADAKYLLMAAKHGFPSVDLDLSDIISNWAGLRPLIHEEGKSPSELSRKDEIFVSDHGLISIAGGKLTGYRKMAKRIVDLVVKQFKKEGGKSFPKCNTKNITLTTEPFSNFKEVKRFIENLNTKLIAFGLENYHAWYLTTTYGKEATKIIEKLNSFKNDAPHIALGRAEAWFGIHHEMTNCAEDFFVRQTGRLYFNISSIPSIREKVMQDFEKYLSWEETRVRDENKKLDDLLFDATHFYENELTV